MHSFQWIPVPFRWIPVSFRWIPVHSSGICGAVRSTAKVWQLMPRVEDYGWLKGTECEDTVRNSRVQGTAGRLLTVGFLFAGRLWAIGFLVSWKRNTHLENRWSKVKVKQRYGMKTARLNKDKLILLDEYTVWIREVKQREDNLKVNFMTAKNNSWCEKSSSIV